MDASNDFKMGMETMLKGLTGMIDGIDKAVKDNFKNMGKEDAEKFAKAMTDADIKGKTDELKSELNKVKDAFKVE